MNFKLKSQRTNKCRQWIKIVLLKNPGVLTSIFECLTDAVDLSLHFFVISNVHGLFKARGADPSLRKATSPMLIGVAEIHVRSFHISQFDFNLI
jgi:hypothetical protein